MPNEKVKKILERVRSKLMAKGKAQPKSHVGKDPEQQFNTDRTDPLFPTSPTPTLPITGPQQGMIATRNR